MLGNDGRFAHIPRRIKGVPRIRISSVRDRRQNRLYAALGFVGRPLRKEPRHSARRQGGWEGQMQRCARARGGDDAARQQPRNHAGRLAFADGKNAPDLAPRKFTPVEQRLQHAARLRRQPVQQGGRRLWRPRLHLRSGRQQADPDNAARHPDLHLCPRQQSARPRRGTRNGHASIWLQRDGQCNRGRTQQWYALHPPLRPGRPPRRIRGSPRFTRSGSSDPAMPTSTIAAGGQVLTASSTAACRR